MLLTSPLKSIVNVAVLRYVVVPIIIVFLKVSFSFLRCFDVFLEVFLEHYLTIN